MRWTSKDPILFGGVATNLYSYSNLDPINFYDLEGERYSPIGIGAFLGIALTTIPFAALDTGGALKCSLRIVNPCSPEEKLNEEVNDAITPSNFINPYRPIIPPPRDRRPKNNNAPRREGDNLC